MKFKIKRMDFLNIELNKQIKTSHLMFLLLLIKKIVIIFLDITILKKKMKKNLNLLIKNKYINSIKNELKEFYNLELNL